MVLILYIPEAGDFLSYGSFVHHFFNVVVQGRCVDVVSNGFFRPRGVFFPCSDGVSTPRLAE